MEILKLDLLSKKRAIPAWALLCVLIGFIAASLTTPVSADIDTVIKGTPGSFSDLVDKASPSVVNISTVEIIQTRGYQHFSPFGPNDPFRDFFDRFYGDQKERKYRRTSLGTGFIIDKEGYILTNNHVVERADEIKVTLSDKREYDAEITGRDPKTDLALIKIKPDDDELISLALGDSGQLDVGDWVIAIGNPYGLGNTVTAGIVSAKYRQIGASSYENYIQTDASINPGNSGGPLLDTEGKVVGINTAIFSENGGSIGIGFAIPVNMAKDLLPQLKKGKVVRGWLGVMIQSITSELSEKLNLKDTKGALVADVVEDGPAEKAGIQRGDVIVGFDKNDINKADDLPYTVAKTPVGKDVEVVVIRNGKRKTIDVELGELEEETEIIARTEQQLDLGLEVEELTPSLARSLGIKDTEGVVVLRVESGSVASEAGMRQGDIILEIDQESIKDISWFRKKIGSYKDGDTILFLIKRQGVTTYLTLDVTE
ncbi:MAG: DegQ family serine endoprotease [Deltaproteobacteria bacterium]|nr:DegQ family serine endoprotease [Deltaproteobacteria bacterium]MBW1914177.1 DegQ family serine endoprotease [Deltaproteobacteria bacterium]